MKKSFEANIIILFSLRTHVANHSLKIHCYLERLLNGRRNSDDGLACFIAKSPIVPNSLLSPTNCYFFVHCTHQLQWCSRFLAFALHFILALNCCLKIFLQHLHNIFPISHTAPLPKSAQKKRVRRRSIHKEEELARKLTDTNNTLDPHRTLIEAVRLQADCLQHYDTYWD